MRKKFTPDIPADYQGYIDSLSDGILIIDKNFKVQKLNAAIADLLGIDISTGPGQYCYQLVHGTDAPPKHCLLNQLLSKGELQQKSEAFEPHLGCSLGYRLFPQQNKESNVSSFLEIITISDEESLSSTACIQSKETAGNGFMGITEAMSEMVDIRDPYTAGHSRGVVDWAIQIAVEMGMDDVDVDGIRVCAILHDIGKIAISSNILSKPGRLTNNEWLFMKEHPKVAQTILSKISFPWPVSEVVYQHHERMDGSGYPQGLQKDEIHLWARILAVADVIDAMITHRPYRAALLRSDLIDELQRGRGEIYDKNIVDAAVTLLGKQDRRVLVVDDEVAITKLINRFLKKLNIEVHAFIDPCEAIEVFRKKPFPVVITDLSMPEMNGLELLGKIRQVHSATRAIIVTGHADKELAVEALRLGAVDFLEKPIQFEALKSIVESMLIAYHEQK